jgi:hypothetical protein
MRKLIKNHKNKRGKIKNDKKFKNFTQELEYRKEPFNLKTGLNDYE